MTIQPVDDSQLVKACFGGKTEAFGAIVRKYQSFICSLTYSAVGDFEKSEELAQEIFIIAWNHLSQIKDSSKFKSWLFQITKNHIRHFFRSQKRDLLSGALPITEAESVDSRRDDPVLHAISLERRQMVWNALRQIPSQYRDPLILYYREGKSIRQVAAFFDLTEMTAKKCISRARTMVKSQIEKDLDAVVSDSCPGERFSTSVMAVIAGGTLLAAGSASAVTAASVAAGAEGTGWFSSLAGSITAKIAAVATVAAILAVTGSYVVSDRASSEPIPVISILPAEMSSGLVLYLSFDTVETEAGQTKIVDESYSGNDGILQGGRFVKGKIGRALQCRANDKTDGVVVKDSPSLDLNAVTIAAWIKTDLLDGRWNRILDKGWQTAYNLCVGGDSKGQSRFRSHAQLECAGQSFAAKATITDDRWHLVVGTYDSQRAAIYIDGRPDAEYRFKKTIPIQHNEADLRIGQLAVPEMPPFEEAFFDGLIDEVRLYNRVLSDEEILTLYRYAPGY